MSCILTAVRLMAILVVVGLAGAGLAADPAPKPAPPGAVATPPAPSCGGLPRGCRAFKDCLTAQAGRAAAPGGQTAAKPAFSSR
jgi:hypothetical protein